jgi:polyisoprenyl-phosphate glycosyltransferase
MPEEIYSVIIPCYNEEENINEIYSILLSQVNIRKNLEIIFIDDGSEDNTLLKIKDLAKVDSKVKYLSFSRNFGHQNAVKAGLDFSTGDCVISMDADLQHPPDIIEKLINFWQEGFDVVYTVRKSDPRLPVLKRITSKYFYKILNFVSDIEIMEGAADFRLLDRKVVNVLKEFNENYLFIRGLVSWVGFKQTYIEYNASERLRGTSKYSTRKMLKFASSGITSFSIKPLRVSVLAGLFIASCSFLYGLYALYMELFTNNVIQGWTSVIVSVLFIGGLQLFTIGVLGEYLGKMFIENKRRPNYIIKESKI